MGNFFHNFSESLSKYFFTANYASLEFWLYIFLPLLVIWGISKLILLAQKPSLLKRRFSINKSVFISSMMVLAILIAVYCYYWVTGYYNFKALEFSHLISLIPPFVVGLISLIGLSSLFKRETQKEIIGQPLSKMEQRQLILNAKNKYKQLKYYLIIPVLGFLMLLLVSMKNYNLVSIVLDTSSSMKSSLSGDTPPLEMGKNAIIRTVKELDKYTDVIITTFQEGDTKGTIEEILDSSSEQLKGRNNIFFGGDRAISLIEAIGESDDISSTSPLCETIWKNYFFTLEQSTDKNYAKIVSIIISDGRNNLGENMQGFLCGNNPYDELFGQNVNVINLSEGTLPSFISKAQDCGYSIEDGYDALSYNASLNRIFNEYKSDWNFIYSMLMITLFCTFLTLLINPKPIIE